MRADATSGGALPPGVALAREDQRVGRILTTAAMVILLLVGGVFGWIATFEISGAVIARGTIVVDQNSKAIQHLEGGIIQAIHVRDGQRVERGALLVQLSEDAIGERARGITSQLAAKAEQLKLLKEEYENLKTLEEKRLIPRKQVIEAERMLAELNGDIGKLKADSAGVAKNRERMELRAPVAGRVHALSVHNVGAVIGPAQVLMRIVPEDADLSLEAKVAPQDIDQVRPGQTATLRFTSFNQRTTPELVANIGHVSADLVRDEAAQSFHYLARVVITPDERARLGEKRLMPGMPADVFIETGSRSILSYLLKPLTDNWREALREP
ncbi:MAG: HlyD family efflux transporter periplasmic adaptor subunit [Pseudomonadota bacterium]